MATTLGLDCKLYRGNAGGKATTEMKNVTNVTVSLESGEADITTRAAEGWKMSAATLKEASVEFEMLYDPEDEDFQEVQKAYFENTPLAIFVGDGATQESGLDCDAVVTNFSVDQSLEEAVKVSVTMKPTNIGGERGRAPKWTSNGSEAA